MMKINAIVKVLKTYSQITDYAIDEVITKSFEQFYDLQKLETVRSVNTDEIRVRIYTTLKEGDKTYLGDASFLISHKLSKSELCKMIEDAIYQASFVKNEYYEIPSGEKKMNVKAKREEKEPFDILKEIASIFFSEKTSECQFNALECFYTNTSVRLVNSRGVDYKKEQNIIKVEAIPSYKKEGEDRTKASELYRFFKYYEYKESKVREDAHNAILDVLNRSKAVKLDSEKQIDVIIASPSIRNMIFELINTYDYADVYRKSNFKNVGDAIQENPVTPLNISLTLLSKSDYFDSDGVLLKETKIIEDGKIKQYYGNNRYAYYLSKKPTGNLDSILLEKGKLSYEKMKAKPYVEIVDLSGIQVDLFGDYIGGEVRLANYFDGKTTYPITGFSFSTSLQKCINELKLSKETDKISAYEGPKYALLKDVNIL